MRPGTPILKKARSPGKYGRANYSSDLAYRMSLRDANSRRRSICSRKRRPQFVNDWFKLHDVFRVDAF
jgi:hypothetical protein